MFPRGTWGNFKMSIQEEAPIAPDTFGLEEYFVTDIRTEIMGGNVRVICGSRSGREVRWRYSVVMPAEKLMIAAGQLTQAAEEALNFMQMVDRRKNH